MAGPDPGVPARSDDGRAQVRYLRPAQPLLRAVVEQAADIPSGQRDAMAMPTYLHPNPLIRWLFHRRYRVIASLLDVPVGARVLEFGCGIGALLPSLVAAGLDVWALDIELSCARDLARRTGIGVTFVDSLGAVPDASVSAIVAADVLEHVDDLPDLLGEMRRVLEPGGALIVSGPTENVAYRIGRLIAGFGGKGEYHHADARAVERAIARSGMTPERTVTLPLRVPPHLFRIVRFRRS